MIIDNAELTYEYSWTWASPDPTYRDAFRLYRDYGEWERHVRFVNATPIVHFRRPVWRGLWLPVRRG